MDSPDTLPLWVGIRKSAMTPNIEPRLEETSFTLPHRTQKPHKTTATDLKQFAQGYPQHGKTTGSPGTLPLRVGIPNSALTPINSQCMKRQLLPYRTGPQNPQKLPHRTPKILRRGLPSLVRLWGGTRNSAVTAIQSKGLKRQLSPYRTGPQYQACLSSEYVSKYKVG